MSVSRETLGERSRVSRETRARLEVLERLICLWNSRINLVSRTDEPLLWERHISDSLQLAQLIPLGTTSAIDLGSGAGFPGLVLAIATDIPFILVDSDARKAAFLVEASRLTSAPARVVNSRIETARLTPASLVTARALAPLSQILTWAAPNLVEDGTLLLLKGKSVEQEVEEASVAWTMHVDRRISATGDGVMLRITGIARA